MTTKESPFTYLNAINAGDKSDIVVNDSVYTQYLINRGLSLFIDTIAIANEANKYSTMTNQMHFDYMRNMVNPRKRFSKWPKPKAHENASLISQYYNLSMRKAYDLLSIIDDEQLEKIKEELKTE